MASSNIRYGAGVSAEVGMVTTFFFIIIITASEDGTDQNQNQNQEALQLTGADLFIKKH